MQSLPETFPAISVGIGLGKHVDNFEVDIAGIANYLEDGSVPADKIEGLKITFTDTPEGNDKIAILGRFHPRKHAITVHYSDKIKLANQIKLDDFDQVVSQEISGTTVHELEHLVARLDKPFQKIEKRHKRKYTAVTIAGLMCAYGTGYTATGNIVGDNFDAGMFTSPSAGMALGLLALKFFNDNYHRSRLYLDSPEENRCRTAQAEHREQQFVSIQHKK